VTRPVHATIIFLECAFLPHKTSFPGCMCGELFKTLVCDSENESIFIPVSDICYRFFQLCDLLCALVGSMFLLVFLLLIQFLLLILSHDRTKVALQCGFIQVLLHSTLSFLFLIAWLSAASNVNETYMQHK